MPFDANALLQAAQQGATVNPAQGWVQNLNQAAIASQLNSYQTRLKAYIDSSPTGTASMVGDVIGKKIVLQTLRTLLPEAAPLSVVSLGNQVAQLPAQLQHQFTYSLSDPSGNPLLSYTEKTSQLTGKRLTLSYVPADQASLDLINSYLPKPHADGSPILPSEFPTSLPGYLIRLKAQINLDGRIVATANQPIVMGTDLNSMGGFTTLANPSQWDLNTEETNTAGNMTAIGISAGGISPSQLTQLKERFIQTKMLFADSSMVTATSMSNEQVVGDVLTSVIWAWYAVAEGSSRIAQAQTQVIEYPGMSYGLFHAVANPISYWGVIRKVSFPGVGMDVGHIRKIAWSKDNDRQKWVSYNKMRGQYMSGMESAVPERFYNDPAQCNSVTDATSRVGLPTCPQGKSAVRVLGFAASADQKIYTITPEVFKNNPGIVDINLGTHSTSTKQIIQDALDTGSIVTIHEAPINQDGWTGAGIILIDPQTGAGAYLLDGWSNGGSLEASEDRIFTMLSYGGHEAIAAMSHATDMGSAAISGAYMALQAVFECNPQAIINLIFVAVAVAAVVAAIVFGGPAIAAAVAALMAAVAPAGAYAAQDKGCPRASCNAHLPRCLSTRLNDGPSGSHGSGGCLLCYDACMQNEGDWPARSHTGDRCDYWNFQSN